ncbi:MAG TPA: GYD domain-containing protein [Gaiellaceae bacterium]|nr:GYD domain-containing protein [Gaiellaceae bacterium]
MAKFLLRASYTSEGVKGLLREGGTGRRSTIEQLAQGLGGSIEAFYFALGEDDVYVIADFPDNVTAVAVSGAVNAAGAVHLTTIPLVTPEEVDEATKKSVDYRPPGA